jgi:flavin-dependent dehydrogenase
MLDKVLVDAAVAAGAELRQDLVVEELVMDRGQVVGIRGRVKTAGSGENKRVEETARLVIGADGKHSLVAKVVSATEYNSQPALSCAYYTYWEGLELDRVELYSIPKAFAGIASTNDGLAMIYTGYPASEFNAIRGDIEGRFWTTMESIGQAERLLAGRQADRFYGSVDLPNYYRRPYGAGWALVGDSGMNMDPITGQGIGNAFVDVERLVEAVDSWFSGRTDFDTAMSAYEKSRNADTMPIVEFTLQAASFAPPPIEQLVLFEALMHNKKHASQFFGALSGSVSLKEFFATGNIFKIIGPGGMGRVFLGKIKPPRRAAQAAG